jgi:predicted component of type VI protein secretion system
MADASELTTRDVLEQLDRRLTRVEDDLREFRAYVEQALARLEVRLQERFEGRFSSLEARMASLEQRIAAVEAKVDRHFRFTVGLIMISWLCTMSALLLK